MMKNIFTMNFVLFISFLVVGYAVSTKFYHPNSAYANAPGLSISTDPNSIQVMKNGQQSFLLMFVDKLDPDLAHLESLWLVTNLPPAASLQVFPIYPTARESITTFEIHLLQSFKLDRKNEHLTIDQETINFLKANNYWWSGYFIIESNSLPLILDTLIPFDDNGEVANNHQFIRDPDGVINDTHNGFSNQLLRMQNICNRLSGLTQNPASIGDILTSSDLLVTDLEPGQFEVEWNKFLTAKQNLNCTFPTLEISQTNQ